MLKRSIIWLDAGGRTRQTLPATLTGATLIQGDLQAISNAAIVEWFEGTDNFISLAPTSALFPDVKDIARLTFTTGPGNLVDLAVPAPISGIFKPDLVTVDPTAIAVLIGDCIGNLSTSGGIAVTAFVGGSRGLRASGN